MRPSFYESGQWILPTSGTLGNKAKNLLDATETIERSGAKVPRSLVVPFEYIDQFGDKPGFLVSQFDTYFPDWKRLVVRSNSPDEDLAERRPGMYASENVWYKDRAYTGYFVQKVLDSYYEPEARSYRFRHGISEQGMGLLVQELISRDGIDFNAPFVGGFSCFGDFAALTFTDPSKGMEAMKETPLRKYTLKNGITPGISRMDEEEAAIAAVLGKLSDSLRHDGRDLQMEFAVNQNGVYILQVTPVQKTKKPEIAYDRTGNIIQCTDVVGFNQVQANGMLYVPSVLPGRNEFRTINSAKDFDSGNKNYILATIHHNLHQNILSALQNYSAVIDVTRGMIGNAFAAHVADAIRTNKIALAGMFTDDPFTQNMEDLMGWNTTEAPLIFYPAHFSVTADEFEEVGIVKASDKAFVKFF